MAVAKSEALEDTENDPTAKDAVGSIMNFVLATQTVIGQEAQAQMEPYEDYPDMVIGCVGGGSNFSGIFWPYYHDMVSKTAPKQVEFLGVESSAVPKLTQGQYIYDHSDVMRMSPLFKMYTAGHTYNPPEIHTGGLRVHGTAPTLSLLAPRRHRQGGRVQPARGVRGGRALREDGGDPPGSGVRPRD